MRKIFALTLAIMLALTLASLTQAGPRRGAQGKQGGARAPEARQQAADYLGLTQEQKDKLAELRKTNMEALRPLREARAKLLKELAELVKANAKDADLTAKLDQLKENQKAIREQGEKNREAVAAILTPMQQAKAVLMAQQFVRNRALRRGMRGEGPGRSGPAGGSGGAPEGGPEGGPMDDMPENDLP